MKVFIFERNKKKQVNFNLTNDIYYFKIRISKLFSHFFCNLNRTKIGLFMVTTGSLTYQNKNKIFCHFSDLLFAHSAKLFRPLRSIVCSWLLLAIVLLWRMTTFVILVSKSDAIGCCLLYLLPPLFSSYSSLPNDWLDEIFKCQKVSKHNQLFS